MANVQPENGTLRIANELAEALCRVDLSPCESRVLWVIFRKTYGWRKSEDVISLSQFQKLTGLYRASVCRAIQSLKVKNIIFIEKVGKLNMFKIQKNYDLWVGFNSITDDTTDSIADDTTGSINSQAGVVSPPVDMGVSAVIPTKDNKYNIQKGVTLESLKEEIGCFKKMKWEEHKIKSHFLMREIPECLIDEAMGKKF